MTTAENTSRTGEDASPVVQVGTAMAGFAQDIKAMRADLYGQLKAQEERLTMLDRKSAIKAARPALASAGDTDAPHQKAFNAYLRTGDDDALRGLELEGKAMSTAVNSDGGFLVDPQTSETIASVLAGAGSIRAVASVVNVEATSYDVLIDRNDAGAGWANETSATGESGTPTIERISIPLYELNAMPKASQRLLDDSAFDVEAWLAGRVADKFSRAEAAAFVSGDGVDKPKGILSHPQTDNDAWAWGSIGTVPTGSVADVGDGDALITLVYALGAEYRANAAFVMNSKTAGALRKLKARRPSPSAISARATPSPSGPICASCAIHSAPNRMSCSTPPSAWAGTCRTSLRSSCWSVPQPDRRCDRAAGPTPPPDLDVPATRRGMISGDQTP